MTCFARVCGIFTAVVSEPQRGPHVVPNVFMSPYICAMWLVFMSTDKKRQVRNLQK